MKTILKADAILKDRKALKLAALLQLRMALLEERYENCRGHLDEARGLGASESEIKKILKNPGSSSFESN